MIKAKEGCRMVNLKFGSMLCMCIAVTKVTYANQMPQNSNNLALTHDLVKASQDSTAEKAKGFVSMVGQQVIAIIKASQKGRINKDDDFHHLLKTYFNLSHIGQFALGRYWKLATIEEREEYSKLFESVTVKTYASQFDEYTNENLQVTGARMNAENGITVLSRVMRPGHPPLNVNWEISVSKDGTMKIEDLIVNGVSMRITQRSEYMSVIQQHQGKVSGLINALRDQIKRLNAEPQ